MAMEHGAFWIGYAQPCIGSGIADEAPEGSRGATSSCPTDDPCWFWVIFTLHLLKNALGDVVVAAPVGRAFGEGELIKKMPIIFARQTLCNVIDRAGVFNKMDVTSLKLDSIDLGWRRLCRDYSDEFQSDQSREISFGNSR